MARTQFFESQISEVCVSVETAEIGLAEIYQDAVAPSMSPSSFLTVDSVIGPEKRPGDGSLEAAGNCK
jgi:hypothetical protein